jgi:NAD(P)-dependent dehydrogenase (short-subunit alcohol dehydrogenase family)
MPVALVTGASRGVGRGVATSLAAAGYTVFATGRAILGASLPDSIVRVTCDHYDDRQTAAAVARALEASRTIDVLVNAAWGGYERMVEDGEFTWTKPFWQQPLHRWTSMIDGGVRAAFVTAANAVPAMIAAGRGLIVNISFWPAQKYIGNTLYGIAKAATDKLTHDAASELRPHGVSVVSVYPGLVRTEAVLEAAKAGWLDLSNSESPEFIGRVVAALAADSELPSHTGRVVVAAAYAQQRGIVDVDGKQPRPLTLESV